MRTLAVVLGATRKRAADSMYEDRTVGVVSRFLFFFLSLLSSTGILYNFFLDQ
jgi:hypothetical protein